MLKKLVILFVFLLAGSAASAAPAFDGDKTPKKITRSAIQKECMEENAKDHQAYLSCVKTKKEEHKNDAPEAKASTIAPVDNKPAN